MDSHYTTFHKDCKALERTQLIHFSILRQQLFCIFFLSLAAIWSLVERSSPSEQFRNFRLTLSSFQQISRIFFHILILRDSQLNASYSHFVLKGFADSSSNWILSSLHADSCTFFNLFESPTSHFTWHYLTQNFKSVTYNITCKFFFITRNFIYFGAVFKFLSITIS